MEVTNSVFQTIDPLYLIIVFSFVGAIAGEFYREANDNIDFSMVKFFSKFIASWIISLATILAVKSMLSIEDMYLMISLAIGISFQGYNKSLKMLNSIFKNMLKKDLDNKN